MTIVHEKRFIRTDIWREGEWLDLWSVVHFLSGMSVGLGFYFLRFDALAAVALALVSFIAYELWERLVGIVETPANGFMDVVVGMASFLPAFFLLAPPLSKPHLVLVFGFIFAINILLSVLGWRASQKAAALEARLRVHYARGRARVMKQGTRLRERFRRKGIHDETL